MNMRNVITHMDSFTIFGIEKTFDKFNTYNEIPKFWDEVFEKYSEIDDNGNTTILGFRDFGKYAVCIDEPDKDTIRYIIGTIERPHRDMSNIENFVKYKVPEKDWAIFDSTDTPVVNAIQNMSKYVFSDWQYTNNKYEIDGVESIEWYNQGEDSSFVSLWVPVKEKKD